MTTTKRSPENCGRIVVVQGASFRLAPALVAADVVQLFLLDEIL